MKRLLRKVCSVAIVFLLLWPVSPQASGSEQKGFCHLAPTSGTNKLALELAIDDIMRSLKQSPEILQEKFATLTRISGWQEPFAVLFSRLDKNWIRHRKPLKAIALLMRQNSREGKAILRALRAIADHPGKARLGASTLLNQEYPPWTDSTQRRERVARSIVLRSSSFSFGIEAHEHLTEIYGYCPWARFQRRLTTGELEDVTNFFVHGMARMQEFFGPRLPVYWPGLVKMGICNARLAHDTFEAVEIAKKEFGQEFDAHWEDIVSICSVLPGWYALQLFKRGIPTMRNALGERFWELWPDLVRMIKTSKESTCSLLETELPAVRSLLKDDFFKYWPGIVRIVVSAKISSKEVVGKGLPLLKQMFGDELDYYWPGIVRLLVAVGEPSGYQFLQYLRRTKEAYGDEFRFYWKDFVAIGCKARGWVAVAMFANGFPAIKTAYGKKLPMYWERLRYWIKKDPEAVDLLLPAIAAARPLTREPMDLDRVWKDHRRLWAVATSDKEKKDSDTKLLHFFVWEWPATLRKFGKRLPQYWDGLMALGEKAKEHMAKVLGLGVSALMPLIRTPRDLEKVGRQLLQAIDAAKGVETPLMYWLYAMKYLIRKHPELWESLLLPTIEYQRAGSVPVLAKIRKMHRQGLILDEKDYAIVRFITTRKGTRALDILEHLIVRGVTQGVIAKPLSEEAAVLKEFLDLNLCPVVEVYEQFKAIKNKSLPLAEEQRAVKQMARALESLRRAIVQGDVTAEQERHKAFAAMLIYVYPPGMNVTRKEYMRLYKRAKDFSRHVPESCKKVQNRILRLGAGDYQLPRGQEHDVAPWLPFLNAVGKVDQGAASKRKAAQIGEILLAGLANRSLSNQEGRQTALEQLYGFFRRFQGGSLPAELTGYKSRRVYEEYATDILPDLIRETVDAYRKKEPERCRRWLSKAGLVKHKEMAGIANQVGEVVRLFRGRKMSESKAREVAGKILARIELDANFLWDRLTASNVQQIEVLLTQQSVAREPATGEIASKIVDALRIGPYLAGMRGEMKKWVYYPAAAEMRLRAVVSKKRVHAVAELNMGICNAADKYHRENPNYFDLILFDQDDIAQGGLSLLIVQDKGKRYLCLPGINPSMALLSKVQAGIFLDRALGYAQEIADALGLEREIILPKEMSTHSNRPPLQDVIKERGYEVRELSSAVKLSEDPAISFNKVLVVPPTFKLEEPRALKVDDEAQYVLAASA